MNDSLNISRRILQVLASLIVIAAILFVTSGTMNWTWAWIYIIASVVIMIVNAFLFPPELIAERGRKKTNTEKWDRVLSLFIMVPWLSIFIISGLDMRFGWSHPIPSWAQAAGLITFLCGNAVVSWAMVSNAYFSTAVRIQYDRDHKVSDRGPYQLVRHPGYLGMIIFQLSTPIMLGTLWAIIPALATAILFIVRTACEDRTLRSKLDGYEEYAKIVKYRLLNGIW